MYHKSTKVSQGIIKCWIEIIPTAANVKESIVWNISKRPITNFDIRLIIWDTKDVKIMDWEGTSDIYVRAFFDSVNQTKRTDTHYRSMNGKGSFNYRLHFDVENPSRKQVLSLQVWDADLFSKNDFIGDSSLNLALPIEDAAMTNKIISLNKKYYEAFLRDYMKELELTGDAKILGEKIKKIRRKKLEKKFIQNMILYNATFSLWLKLIGSNYLL